MSSDLSISRVLILGNAVTLLFSEANKHVFREFVFVLLRCAVADIFSGVPKPIAYWSSRSFVSMNTSMSIVLGTDFYVPKSKEMHKTSSIIPGDQNT